MGPGKPYLSRCQAQLWHSPGWEMCRWCKHVVSWWKHPIPKHKTADLYRGCAGTIVETRGGGGGGEAFWSHCLPAFNLWYCTVCLYLCILFNIIHAVWFLSHISKLQLSREEPRCGYYYQSIAFNKPCSLYFKALILSCASSTMRALGTLLDFANLLLHQPWKKSLPPLTHSRLARIFISKDYAFLNIV